MIPQKHKILLTSALPYANGDIHIGHLVEYIQTDIYARFLKLVGYDVIYCCADDTHGTAIEIKAQAEGITPTELIARVNREHQEDFQRFHIAFDNYYTTHSEENRTLAIEIYQRLKAKGLIYTREIEVFYDPQAKRFLPDRYIKGRCPKCQAADQYGDVCEICNSAHKPTDLIDPYSTISGATPVRKRSRHYFFKLSALTEQLRAYFQRCHFQPEVVNYLTNWLDEGLQDWDISRDGPYFGFKIPEEDNKYFYVWLDAPIGYFAACQNYCQQHNRDAHEYFFGNQTWLHHIIGKDIMYFHFLFWPAMLMAAGFHAPDDITVHGFLTVNGEKMSKSRGTFITARDFAAMYPPEYLRFFYAKVLSRKLRDIDLDFTAFVKTINTELVGNIGNFCYRVLLFLQRNFAGRLSSFEPQDYPVTSQVMERVQLVRQYYQDLNYNKALATILEISALGNKFFHDQAPWSLQKAGQTQQAQQVCSVCCNIARILAVLLQPIMPVMAAKLQAQLQLPAQTWEMLDFNLQAHTIGTPELLVQKIQAGAQLPGQPETPARQVRLTLDAQVAALGLSVCLAQINGVRVKKKHEGLERLKKQVQQTVGNLTAEQQATLQAFKECYQDLGLTVVHPVEHLHQLIQQQQLPQINTVVDSYNVVSCRTMLPMGAHDLDKIKGHIQLRFAKKGDRYTPLGEQAPVSLGPNEFVYVDDQQNVLCRLNVKQGNATGVDLNTRNVVLLVDGFDPAAVRNATEEVCQNIVRFCGGNYTISQIGPEFPLHLVVARVQTARNHPRSDKLLILEVDMGTEQRQIVAGLQAEYPGDALVGKHLVIVANLKPAKLGGEKSAGMLLAAGSPETGYRVLEAPQAAAGQQVSCGKLPSRTTRIKIEVVSRLKMRTDRGQVLVPAFGQVLEVAGKPLPVDMPDGCLIS